jgi:hypothetical protein
MGMDELQAFLSSGELGVETKTSSDTLQRAAEKMFTAKGLSCPVVITRRQGRTYIIRRDAVARSPNKQQ